VIADLVEVFSIIYSWYFFYFLGVVVSRPICKSYVTVAPMTWPVRSMASFQQVLAVFLLQIMTY